MIQDGNQLAVKQGAVAAAVHISNNQSQNSQSSRDMNQTIYQQKRTQNNNGEMYNIQN